MDFGLTADGLRRVGAHLRRPCRLFGPWRVLALDLHLHGSIARVQVRAARATSGGAIRALHGRIASARFRVLAGFGAGNSDGRHSARFAQRPLVMLRCAGGRLEQVGVTPDVRMFDVGLRRQQC